MENKIRDLIEKLNYYNKLYDEGHPEISDKEYDDLYFELVGLEQTYHIYFEDSPTQRVDYQVINELEKVEHGHKMISLEKTKDVNAVRSCMGNSTYLTMAKMDGLTCSLRYENGRLVGAETRGNGIIGENILHNILHLHSVPNKINCESPIVVIDGEIICTYSDFKQFETKYANPRNFAAGSIRLLDSKECSCRNLTFVAWDVIEGFNELELLSSKLEKIKSLGFTIVPMIKDGNIETNIENIKEECSILGYPIDGCVFKFDNIEYGKSLGATEHHFKNAIAYKFYDEEYETELKNIEWTMGKTGQITPVAVFIPVDIDGTYVSRASLHNISIMKQTLHGCGFWNQKVYVVKRNQIIPNIEHAEKGTSTFTLPNHCPICGGDVEVRCENESEVLYCINPSCEGKLLNLISHYCDMKKGLSIKGLSNKTIEKLIDLGWIQSFKDLYTLRNHFKEWINLDGFGDKSVNKILDAIDNSKYCQLENFISALSIPLIGLSNAKEIVKYVKSVKELADLASSGFDFEQWPTFGPEKALSLKTFNYDEAIYIEENYLQYEKEDINNSSLSNITFVITGKLNIYKNRDELTNIIEKNGGKVAGSISNKTNYLINNDINSTSAKNKKAKELNIPIISEENFKKIFDL